MMWLTWRQFRVQAAATAAVLVAAAVAMIVTGVQLANAYGSYGLPSCHTHGNCAALASKFLNQVENGAPYRQVYLLMIALALVLPAVIGIFWGAPLIAREIETGTFRMAWNQSVTRRRWTTVKLGAIGLAAVVASGLLALGLTWWVSPVYKAVAVSGANTPPGLQRFSSLIFDSQGLVPLGYAAFAFLLGVTAGVLIKRTIPAMAVTLVVFAVVQVAWGTWIRPHLIAPLHAVYSIAAVAIQSIGSSGNGNHLFLTAGGKSGEWILGSHAVNAAGHAVSAVPLACRNAFNGPNAFQDCLTRTGIKVAVTYQPDSRFWDFQLIETGVFVAIALLLGWLCVTRISRRLA